MDALPHDLVVHVASYHEDRAAGYNERNFGLGLRAQDSDWRRVRWAGGFFRNSLSRFSVYAGAELRAFTVGPVSGAILVGAATGYVPAIALVAVPEFKIRLGDFGIIINYLPATTWAGEAAGVSISRGF